MFYFCRWWECETLLWFLSMGKDKKKKGKGAEKAQEWFQCRFIILLWDSVWAFLARANTRISRFLRVCRMSGTKPLYHPKPLLKGKSFKEGNKEWCWYGRIRSNDSRIQGTRSKRKYRFRNSFGTASIAQKSRDIPSSSWEGFLGFIWWRVFQRKDDWSFQPNISLSYKSKFLFEYEHLFEEVSVNKGIIVRVLGHQVVSFKKHIIFVI